MSSRGSTRSRSSSTSPSEAGSVDDSAADRLAALERLLQSSLGYDEIALAEVDHEEGAEGEERPKKKRKKEKAMQEREVQRAGAETVMADVAGAAATAGEEEVVAFRLFSTQRAPTQIVIREVDEELVVLDPRIRDVADEPKSTVKKRQRAIASLALDGETIRVQALSQPPSRFPNRLTHRIRSQRSSTLPTLAYLNAVLPLPLPSPALASTQRPTPSSTTPGKPTRPRRKRTPSRQAPRRPLERLVNVRLAVVPILKGRTESRGAGGKVVGSKAGGVGKRRRTRLSKERRARLRGKMARAG